MGFDRGREVLDCLASGLPDVERRTNELIQRNINDFWSCGIHRVFLLLKREKRRAKRRLWPAFGLLALNPSVVAQHFGHVPERLVELQILIDAFNGSALRHSAAVSAASASIALTTLCDVLLNRVQAGPEILCAVSISAGIEQHGRIDWGFVRVLPSVSSRASGKG